MAKQATAARAALAAAVQAMHARATERRDLESAVAAAEAAVNSAWVAVDDVEIAIRERPRSAADAFRERVAEHGSRFAIAQLDAEPESTRELRDRLARAEETARDAGVVRDELQTRLSSLNGWDPTLDRARQAARAVLRDEAGPVIAQAIAEGEAALAALQKARVTLDLLEYHDAVQELRAVRAITQPLSDSQQRLFLAARYASPWATIVDRLVEDPTAPLPN